MASPVNHINIDQAVSTTATLVAAKAGYKIQVTNYTISCVGAVPSVKSTLQDETSNTVRSTFVGHSTQPVIYVFEGGPNNPAFETAVGEGLEFVTGTGSSSVGYLNYRYIK